MTEEKIKLCLCVLCTRPKAATCVNLMNADPQLYAQYNASDHIKIVLKIADEAALQQLYEKCIETGVAAHIVVDKGFTQIPANTKTVIAIGPARESLLRPIIGHLALL